MTNDRWPQLEELYHAAREDRTVLDKADPELRREVESLLAQEKAAGFLESPALEVAAQQFVVEPGKDFIGRRIGVYQILSLLGSGGMGQVYRAKDSKLKREVALKVLPDVFANDPERMARFQREAEVLAALNHPNIAQIYGVEDRALVMELVPGKTLKGPLPIETALDYAKQIAEALEAAHEKGITHRDLKPSNIMITAAGVVKVLDFGLAAQSREHEERETLTTSPTSSGMILGTAAYMSPEQARGETVDKQADIWAFGAVLYEILTGKQAFSGETASDTLASVLKNEPEWNRVPQRAQRLLRRCLEKDPTHRLHDIADAMALVDEVAPAKSAPARSRLGMIALAVAALAVLVARTGLAVCHAGSAAPAGGLNAEITTDAPLARARGGGVLALSPNGTRLALTSRGIDGKVRLHTRLLNQDEVTPLAGTENAFSPFFSPDGEWIGFFADGKLKKISAEGGAAVTLSDAPDPDGASWGDDGNIVAALNGSGGAGLWRVSAAGGRPVPLTKLNPGEVTHRWPQVLPGSQAVLFTAHSQFGNYDDANIDVVSLQTGERRTVQRGGFFPRYLASSKGTGHLIYLHQSTLFAVPFDFGRLALDGVPAPVLEDVSSTATAGGDFASSEPRSGEGTFVYLRGKGPGPPISWLDRAGKIQPLHAPAGVYTTLRFSPDGKRLAFSMASGTGEDIWVRDLGRDTPSRLSFLTGLNRNPVWAPDGKTIVFKSTNPAAPGLYCMRSDGSGEAQRLTDGKLDEIPFSISPDGKRLAFAGNGNGGSEDIFIAPIEGDSANLRVGKTELFLGTPFREGFAEFSPDGRWLAYESNESGTYEVYVRPFPGPGGRWQISTGGGFYPLWSRGGRELLFQTLDRQVMVVSYSVNGDSFVAGKPQMWSRTRLLNSAGVPLYDLAPDGKRLAAILASEEPPTHLTFLLNFFDELRRRAPLGGK